MTCNQYIPSNTPEFTGLEKGVVISVLLESIEKCLLTYKTDMFSLFPELEDWNETVVERFYDGEFSHLFQIAVSKSSLAGFVTFHDENTRPSNMLKRKKNKGLDRQIDLGIRLNYSRDRVMVIEGKRLHSSGDSQYVSGNTGGICRFKREQHGEELERACMVGFMEKKDFHFWHHTINRWVDNERTKSTDMNWIEDELLTQLEVRDVIFAKCHSTHARLTKLPIELTHYWVNVN